MSLTLGSRRALLLCSSVASLLVACSSSAPRLVPTELTEIKPTAEIVVRWQAAVGGAGEFVFTPAVVADSVYAAASDGTLVRFDQGGEVWRINVGRALSGGVGSDGKIVVVATAKGEVLAYDAQDAHAVWRATVSSEVLAAPVVGDGLVVVRSGDAQLFAFEAASGKRRWVYQRATPTLSLRSNVGVVLVPGRAVLAGYPGGKLVALALNNGVALWEVAVVQPKGATELERIADLASLPVLDGLEVCAVAYQGRVACYDIGNGSQVWSREISSIAGMDIDAKTVYVSDAKGAVHALDRVNGASLWKQDKLMSRSISRPLVLGKYLALGDYQGIVHLLRSDDGSFAARIDTDGSAIAADPQRSGRAETDFVVQTQNGGLYALSARGR